MIKLTLRGSLVYLRRPTPRDEMELIRLNMRSAGFHGPWATPPLTRADFEQYMERCREKDYAGFLICQNEGDEIVGAINLSQIFQGTFQNACVGYYMGAASVGRGYMTEALQLVLRYAFEELKLHRIEANIQPHNVPSVRLVRRAGFRLEGFSPRYLKIAGRWRDHQRWAILADEWRPRTPQPSAVIDRAADAQRR